MEINDGVPHIEAQCAKCGFLFDMKWGLDCPACHGVGVRWARVVTNADALSGYWENHPEEYIERMRIVSLTEGDYADIAELDRMYAMEDPR